jgi:hypothetical protein
MSRCWRHWIREQRVGHYPGPDHFDHAHARSVGLTDETMAQDRSRFYVCSRSLVGAFVNDLQRKNANKLQQRLHYDHHPPPLTRWFQDLARPNMGLHQRRHLDWCRAGSGHRLCIATRRPPASHDGPTKPFPDIPHKPLAEP